MKRWGLTLALLAAWLIVGLLALTTKQAGLFTLSAGFLLAGVVAAIVAVAQGARLRSAQREEQTQLLRDIAAQGRQAEEA